VSGGSLRLHPGVLPSGRTWSARGQQRRKARSPLRSWRCTLTTRTSRARLPSAEQLTRTYETMVLIRT